MLLKKRNIGVNRSKVNNTVKNLIINQQIKTTTAQAKITARAFDRILTKAKNIHISDTNANPMIKVNFLRHMKAKYRFDIDICDKLLILAKRSLKRPGGYASVAKILQKRKGDGADMSFITIVDNDLKFSEYGN